TRSITMPRVPVAIIATIMMATSATSPPPSAPALTLSMAKPANAPSMYRSPWAKLSSCVTSGLLVCRAGGIRERSEAEARRVGVRRVEQVLRGAGDPGAAGDGRQDARAVPDRRPTEDAAGEPGADERLVDEVPADRQLATGVQLCHPGTGARAAGRPVEPARMDRHGVP